MHLMNAVPALLMAAAEVYDAQNSKRICKQQFYTK